MKMHPKKLPTNITILNQIQRRRFQTLLAVDDLVERIVLMLKKLKVFHKTYFIVHSDNGFHIGKGCDKNFLARSALEVEF